MIRRIFKHILLTIKQEFGWFRTRRWMKSRATRYTV